MNLSELLSLKFPNASFLKDIILQDDGTGAFIKEWNVIEHPKPTKVQMDQWKVEFDLAYRQQEAVARRIYPRVEKQLEMIYNDKINNTTTWVDTITSIKLANPKPTV